MESIRVPFSWLSRGNLSQFLGSPGAAPKCGVKRSLWCEKVTVSICAMVKSRVLLGMGDIGRPPTFNRNPYNGYIHPYYWVDDHPLLYGNNVSSDPGTYHVLVGR